jgi:hypothetical protein
MKKLLSIVVSSVAFAAVAGISPTIGVTEVAVTQQNSIIPVVYKSLETGGDMKANALVATRGLPDSTQLFVFADNTYTAWVLINNTWTAVDSSSTAIQGITPGTPASDQTLPVGNAIWIVFPESYAIPDGQKVYISGKVQSTGLTTRVYKKGSTTAMANLLCNPTEGTVTGAQPAEQIGNNAATKDVITLAGGTFAGDCIFNGTVWKHYAVNESGEMTVTEGLPDIPAGQAFWYTSKSGEGSFTINW